MGRTIPALDLMFLLSESPDSPSHVGALLPFELPAGADRRFIGKLVDEYRRARPVAPFNQVPHFPAIGRPVWREVSEFDMEYHVQHVALPQPGSTAQLNRLIETIHNQVLDRNQPLFQLFVIEGLEKRRFALFFKMHHACIDGQSAMARGLASLGTKRGARRPPPFYAVRAPATRPRLPKTFNQRLAAMPAAAMEQGSALRDLSMSVLKKIAGSVLATNTTILPFTAPRAVSNEAIRAGRSFAALSLPIDEMRAVGKAFGGTLNDVAVTVADAGFTSYLKERDKLPRRALVAMCPVSLRDAGDAEATTKVSVILAPLGGADLSASARLERVIANIGAAKDEIRRLSKKAALDLAVLLFAIAEGLGRLEIASIARPPANFILSNVPGSKDALYLGSARLLAMYPVSMLAGRIGLNVTLASCGTNMDFGFVANRSAMRDLEPLARHCGHAFEELKRGRK